MSQRRGIAVFIAVLLILSSALCGCTVVAKNSVPSDTSTPDTSTETTDAATEAVTTPQTEAETTEPETTVVTEALTEADNETSYQTEPGEIIITQVLSGTYVPPETNPPETNPPQSYAPKPYTPPADGRYAPVVLMYHLILETPYTSLTSLFVRPTDFAAHLDTLSSLGYQYLFAEDYRYTDTKSVILTFDDGYIDNYTEMFPILKAKGAVATIFLVSDLIDTPNYLTSDMIREMSASGLVSFQCHTATHASLAAQSETEIRWQYDHSCTIITSLTGKAVTAVSYPAGRYNNTVLRISEGYFDFGYTTDYSISTKGYSTIALPRVRINRGVTGAGLRAMLGF